VASFDEAIPPGQVGKVSAAMKTEGMRGMMEKSITVTTNDPALATVFLRLKATVVGSVVLQPRPGLMFPWGAQWEWSSKILVRKEDTETGELKITDVKPDVPWLLARATAVRETLPPAEGLPMAFPGDWILEVTVGEDAPKTQGGHNVKFKTGLSREPEVTVPVSIALHHPLRAVPNALYLPEPSAGAAAVTGTITTLLRPGLAKETVTAAASPEAFSVKVEPEGVRKFKATVVWTRDPALGDATPKQGNVVLRVGDDSQTVLVRVGAGDRAATPPLTPRPSGGAR
jgi:hypothetical protein